jgi:hypothetical protein
MRIFLVSLLVPLLFFSCTPGTKDDAIVMSHNKAQAPYLAQDHEGNTVLCWTETDSETGENFLLYAIADKGASAFSSPIKVTPSKSTSFHDESMNKVAFTASGNVVAVYELKFPSEKNKYAGKIMYTISKDQGATWSEATCLHTDTSDNVSRSFFDIVTMPDGEVGAVWLDGRHKNTPIGTGLFFTKTVNGNSFAKDTLIAETVCQCCRTTLVTDEKGAIHIAYRDIVSDTIRDMFYISSLDTGKGFSVPQRISADNWKIDGCPHTGPDLVQNKNGLHFTWFTAGGGTGIFYSNSKDGKTFSKREILGTDARHPQIAAIGETVAIVWDQAVQKPTQVNNKIMLHLRPFGLSSQTKKLTPESKNAFFPVIAVHREKLVVAYTVQDGDDSSVEVMFVGE